MVRTKGLPPSVRKAIARQKQRDISTGRATSVTVSRGAYGNPVVTSATGAEGQAVSQTEALKTPEQKVQETEKVDSRKELEKYRQAIFQKQIKAAEKRGEKAYFGMEGNIRTKSQTAQLNPSLLSPMKSDIERRRNMTRSQYIKEIFETQTRAAEKRGEKAYFGMEGNIRTKSQEATLRKGFISPTMKDIERQKNRVPPVRKLYSIVTTTPTSVFNFVKSLAVLSSKNSTIQQKEQALKTASQSIKRLETSRKNVNIIKDYVFDYVRNYPSVFYNSVLTKQGAYNTLKFAASSILSPIVGANKSVEQVARDIKLTVLTQYANKYYSIVKPKTQREIDVKNFIYRKLEEAISSSEQNRQKYKQDILNAMMFEAILLVQLAGGGAATALATAGRTGAATALKTATTLPIQAIWKYQVGSAILNPTSKNLGGVLPFIIIGKISNQGTPKKFSKYLAKLPETQRKIIGNIWKVGKVVKKELGKQKLKEFDFKDIIKNDKIRKVFTNTAIKLKAVLYGSKIENTAKLEYIRNVYSKILGRKLTNKQALEAFYKSNKNIPREILDSLLDKPKDLDFVIQKRYVNDLINKFDSKYRYIPMMVQEYIKSKVWTRKMDFGLKQIRKDKSSVLSILLKKQIDAVLKGFTQNAETTAFKLEFLEGLYKTRAIPKRAFKDFDLEGSGLENIRLNLKLDLHSDSEVAFTRKILGFINKRQSLPLEMPKKTGFKKSIFQLQKTKNYIIEQRKTYLESIANKFGKDFKKIGLILNKDKFVKIFPKFLERSGITEVKGFDFLETPRPAVNKKILKTYQEAIDFIRMATPNKLASRGTISRDVKINILAQKLINYAKATANKLSGFDAAISKLDARRLILVYYSTGSRRLWNFISKFNVKDFKLKKELSVKEQEQLLKMIENFDTNLQAQYTDKKINAEINKIKIKTTLPAIKGDRGFVDLGKTVDRALQLIKNFKTDKLIVTKDGKWSLKPKEQLDRRVAGAISRIFESRRAKDLKKLYNDLKLIELIQRNILNAYNKAPLLEKARLLARFKKGKGILKGKIKTFMKIADKMTSDMQRIESIFTTKGVSETVGMKDIQFDDYNTAKATKILNNLQIRKADINRIENQMKLRLENKISRRTVINRGTKIIAERIIKAAENKVIPRRTIRSYISKLRGLMLHIAASKVRKELATTNSIYAYKLPSSAIRSIQRSISRVLSLSQSRSLSKSQISSISKSISRSVSKSASLSKSQSISLSQSISKSISKSISLSKSQSRSVSRSISKSQSISKSKSKSNSRSITRIPPPEIPRIVLLPTFQTKLPNGYRRLINPIIRVRGVNRELKWRTTFNRALKRIISLVDNTTTRSFQLKIVGITRQPDIKTPPSLRKFRIRRGIDKRVLKFVEKSRYAIDTRGEKRGLKIGKLIKRK